MHSLLAILLFYEETGNSTQQTSMGCTPPAIRCMDEFDIFGNNFAYRRLHYLYTRKVRVFSLEYWLVTDILVQLVHGNLYFGLSWHCHFCGPLLWIQNLVQDKDGITGRVARREIRGDCWKWSWPSWSAEVIMVTNQLFMGVIGIIAPLFLIIYSKRPHRYWYSNDNPCSGYRKKIITNKYYLNATLIGFSCYKTTYYFLFVSEGVLLHRYSAHVGKYE